MRRIIPQILLFLCPMSYAFAAPTILPREFVLNGPESSVQLSVFNEIDGTRIDLTRNVTYRTSDPDIANVSADGWVRPVGEGKAIIVAVHSAFELKSKIRVTRLNAPDPVSFTSEIQPILTKSTCNSGGCHGKAEGQNGFQLSIFGFDSDFDHRAITREGRGRRINILASEESLLLKKATGKTPHGGGAKLESGGSRYRRIARWIAEGASRIEDANPIVRIDVSPPSAQLRRDSAMQLQVYAIHQNGDRRCITREAEFLSNEVQVARVDADGLVRVKNVPGEAAILVRYLGHVNVSRVSLPQSKSFERPEEFNKIDRFVFDRLTRLGIRPSPLASDSTFLRRAFLDTIGTLPTIEESRAFLANKDPNKKERLVDQLLKRDEFADFWAMKWADVLRVDREIVKSQGTIAMTRWLRDQFRADRPYDQMVQDILTFRGSTLNEGPGSFYVVHKDPEMLARSVSQVFLGVRIECAQCHHHPFERWGQSDYYAFAGFFTGIARNGAANGGTKIMDQPGSNLKHPRTNEDVSAAGLGAEPVDFSSGIQRRHALANWMTNPENPFLGRVVMNRLWAHYFGRGLIEPIDDIRATNPASNEPLMEYLTSEFKRRNFDLKAMTKLMLLSRTYQLSGMTDDSNRLDHQNYSHAAWKPLSAEVLLDAIAQVTDVPEQFNGWPEGYRAIHIWDNRLPSYFFRIFGKPQRVSVCECERGSEPSIVQALHLMNSPESRRKIRDRKGRAFRLANSERTASQIIEELYLSALNRIPSEQEMEVMLAAFRAPDADRRTATEDVMWTLLNTREFVFNH